MAIESGNNFLDSVLAVISAITGFSILASIFHRRQSARITVVEEDLKTKLPRTEADLLGEKIVSDLKLFFKNYYKTIDEVDHAIDNAHEKITLTIQPLQKDVEEIKSQMSKMYHMVLELHKSKD